MTRILSVSEKIIGWYGEHGRDLPWRETKDPYHIMIAEIMLQKTSASQVLPVYDEIVKRWPTPADLLDVKTEVVAQMMYPLGLQNVRSKRLKKLAQVLVEEYDGKVPSQKDELLSLPGVGLYICSGVRCMAFDVPVPMLDSNAGRLFGRYYFDEKMYSEIYDKIRDKVEKIFPEEHFKEFNLGVIDMGALVCKQTHPICSDCPLKEQCRYTR